MREVTAKELVTAFEAVLVDVQPVDYIGITFEMTKANIDYREEDKQLVFVTGNHNTDGGAAVILNENWIDCIEFDEEDNVYVISFVENMSDIEVFRHKSAEELELERAERKQ